MQESEASRQEEAVVRAVESGEAAAQAPEAEPAACAPAAAEEPEPPGSEAEVVSGQAAAEPAGQPELPLDEPVPQPEQTAAEPEPLEPAIESEEALEAAPAAQAGSEPAPEPAEPERPPAGDAELRAVVEAIVYVTEEPVTAAQIAAVVKRSEAEVKAVLEALAAACAAPERGVMVREVAGGYKVATKAEHHEMLRAFAKSLKPPLKLSLAALETLAAIAYKQPITAPEIMEIRGVQGAGVLKTLLDRKLIQTAGRKAVVGKPILYKTSKEFLVQFGLRDLSELPTLKEFEELRRLAASEPETPSESPAGPEPAAAAVAAAAEAADGEAGCGAAPRAAAASQAAPAGDHVHTSRAESPAQAGSLPHNDCCGLSEEQTTSEDANAPGTAPEDSGERRGDQPAQS